MMNYSNEGLTDRLEYSDRVKSEANNKLATYKDERNTNSRSLTTADIKEGQRVIRRWCGNKTKSAVLMETIRVGF